MLDQNTDRMWFVIGALVVGAGIILLANKAMPQIFASVTESFENVSNPATDVVTYKLGQKTSIPFSMDVIRPTPSAEKSVFTRLSPTQIRFQTTDVYDSGIYFPDEYFKIGETYTITFDIRKLSGEIEGLGGHLLLTDNVDVRIDGQIVEEWEKGSGSVVDRNSWSNTVVYPNDLDEHHVELTFTKTKEERDIKGNLNTRVYIQPNRSPFEHSENALPFEVVVSDIELYVHEKEGA